MKILLTAFLLLFFTACSTTYPAITQYRIEVQELGNKKLQGSCKKHSLKVSQAFVRSSLMSKKMKYVLGRYEEGVFQRSEWAQNMNKALSDSIVSSLDGAELFKSVTSYKSLSGSDYRLESRVDEFTQYFAADEKSSVAKVDITFTLIDNKTAAIIATKHIVKEMPTKAPDAKSGVAALNELLSETLQEMQVWLAGSCQ
jgi:ABC-type uncharacterized transport system auxiliary subunit